MRRSEGDEEAVALGAHLVPAKFLDDGPDDAAAVPSRLNRAVEPSMSLNSIVTVPLGNGP
ncbi:MAG: hypothetical protein ABJA34_13970 [Pseudonocardiales bacterium]